MLGRIILGVIVILFCRFILQIVMPMRRFVTKRDDIQFLHVILSNTALNKEIIFDEEQTIETKHFTLKFSNSKEASLEFEKCINETLEYCDAFDWLVTINLVLQEYKEELYSIRTEVRRLRLSYKN